MSRPDPLAALMRLRSLETRRAKLNLSGSVAALGWAEAEVARLTHDISTETAGADVPAIAAWLPRVCAEAAAAYRNEREARQGLARAQAELASAQAAQRIAEDALLARAQVRRRDALRREQKLLDDLRTARA